MGILDDFFQRRIRKGPEVPREPATVNLFSERVTIGRRSYFFDVEKKGKEKMRLIITESTLFGKVKQRHRILVHEGDIQAFEEGLSKAVGFLKKKAGVK